MYKCDPAFTEDIIKALEEQGFRIIKVNKYAGVTEITTVY